MSESTTSYNLDINSKTRQLKLRYAQDVWRLIITVLR